MGSTSDAGWIHPISCRFSPTTPGDAKAIEEEDTDRYVYMLEGIDTHIRRISFIVRGDTR